MSYIKNISIKLKIVIIITLISTISILLGLIINLTTTIVNVKGEFRKDAISNARLIGEYCVMPMEFNYPDRAYELLNSRLENEHISCVAVYTSNGTLFSSACTNQLGVPENVTPGEAIVEFSKNVLFVQEKIIRNDEYFGTVYIRYYTGLTKIIVRNIIVAAIVLIIVVLLAFSLALHFQKYISLPILKLAEKASEVSETQNYKTTIDKISNDEVGILYERFNQMLSTINTKEKERDKALGALKQSEEKFRNIFNFSLDGILLTNFEGNVMEASHMAGQIFNINLEGIRGKSMLKIMPSAYAKQRGMILRELQSKGEFTFVTSYKNSAGKESFLEFSSKTIQHEGEKAILSLVRDITTRIKADEALRESEERYKKLVENLPSAIALHRDGEIVFVNDAIKSALDGQSKRDFIGRTFLDFIPDKFKETINNHFAITEINATSPSLELKMKKLNGKIIDVELTSMPLFFNRRKAILTVFKDISSRKKVEKDLVVAVRKAEESDKLKSSFLANMSHEIRTPMNGIIGFADLLKKENLAKTDLERYVDVIRTSADRLLGIINDIIDISKIEAGAINVVIEQFNLTSLVDDIYQFFLPQAKKQGLEFTLTCDKTTASEVKTDRNKISQILTNLVSNALKFTKKGKVAIICSLVSESGLVRFEVVDSGVGIPENQQEAIFERFRQADHYLQNFNEGTGLGLSICKGFAISLGGDIWVESEFEKGARFIVEIPLVEVEKAEQPEAKEAHKKKLRLEGKSILIVEDEENNYLYLKELLTPLGPEILWATDGLKAIQFVLDNDNIDFVLMDIKLPVMDGFTAAQKIKAYRQELPIVAQTAFGLEGDKEKSLAAGLDDYISKPIMKDELFEVIEKFIT